MRYDVNSASRAERLMAKMAADPCWFYDHITEQFLHKTPYEIQRAEHAMQLKLQDDCEASVSEWEALLNEPPNSTAKWCDNQVASFGYNRIFFTHICARDDIHGPYFEIIPDPYPCPDCYGECFL